MKPRAYIIAEAGVNHNGERDLAFKLVDAAVAAGADAVKFQTFKAQNLVTAAAPTAEYQKRTVGQDTQLGMLKRLELSYELHHELIRYCQGKNIEFLSTAFDSESLTFITKDLGLKTLKIASGELTNLPFILDHARTGRDLILSTGMASLAEIETALSVIAFGLTQGETDKMKPSLDAFMTSYYSEAGQTALKKKVTVLHCTTEYPAPMVDINLTAMTTIKSAFGLSTGYSDHSEGITIPIAAAALGATLIEKHFTLDRNLPGPDHKASLEPDELRNMVKAIRAVELALGDGLKGPRPSEIKNKQLARKSLVAGRDIASGETYDATNVVIKRPGSGLPPGDYWNLLGRKATRALKVGDVISHE